MCIRDRGTVWGSLMCTTSMDKLGKIAYSMQDSLYKYKGVPVPPLGMVDDIINVSTVENTARMNKCINTFIESKKLRLSETKCFRMHIGRGHEKCPELKVHDFEMKESEKEKYLGDIIDKNGNVNATIENRKKRGQGIINEIMSIINEIPFGKFRTEVAMKLRESMFINSMLFNSEAWHGVTAANITTLEVVDQALLRAILNAHKGTTKEFLYLETGALPIRWIIAQRRINFLKHILSRSENELLRKVYEAQKESPSQGDFVKLVENDLRKLGLTYEEVSSDTISKNMLKKILRERAQSVALAELNEQLRKSTKISSIRYNKLELQDYLRTTVNKEVMNTITALRSRCVRNIKANFPNMNKSCPHCPLKCSTENPHEDTQEHILTCTVLGGSNVDMEFVHAGSVDQRKLGEAVSKLMVRRAQLLEGEQTTTACCLPGAIPDRSTTPGGGATARQTIV